jgi:hypothetical protein
MSEVIFRTVHGSRLYGFAHAGSDSDTYVVTTSKRDRPRQHVNGDTDTVTVGWDTFLRYAMAGSHQSVEALFSPLKAWESHHELAPLIDGLRVAGGEVSAKYERTIRAFCFGDFKRRRHAVRLASNLGDLRECGRFNPVCSPWLRAHADQWAGMFEGEDLWSELMDQNRH